MSAKTAYLGHNWAALSFSGCQIPQTLLTPRCLACALAGHATGLELRRSAGSRLFPGAPWAPWHESWVHVSIWYTLPRRLCCFVLYPDYSLCMYMCDEGAWTLWRSFNKQRLMRERDSTFGFNSALLTDAEILCLNFPPSAPFPALIASVLQSYRAQENRT